MNMSLGKFFLFFIRLCSPFWEEHRLGVFENRVLRRIFGLKRDGLTGENCIMKSFMICTLRQVLLE
jgi:hypothetical protein